MGAYWAMELAPLAITAFFPVFLYPLLGILDTGSTCTAYFKDTNVLFVGGLMFAVAVEDSGLHQRISLRTLSLLGSEPRRLMLGFMCVTAFLSMFMSNTATTAMMLPIAVKVVEEINTSKRLQFSTDDIDPKEAVTRHSHSEDGGEDGMPKGYTPAMIKVVRGFMLCICYSASIGGSGTLIGTGGNVVLSGQLDELYGGETGVTFASWMGFAIPIVILNLILCWLWLSFLYTVPARCCVRRKQIKASKADDNVNQLLNDRYAELGPMTFAEISLCVFFVLLLLGWMLHDPKVIPGWAQLFKKGYTNDAVPVILICCILAIFPSQRPTLHGTWPKPLLVWNSVQYKLPWTVVFLLGGGFALAKGVDKSGFARYISDQLSSFESIPPMAFVAITMIIILLLTEFTSNVVTASIFLPLLASVAKALHMNPLRILIPATMAGAFAFMLPVATPPNALAFGYGFLRVRDMALAGCVMNVICLCTSLFAVNTWGHKMFNLGEIPDWANQTASIVAGH